jgi:hypothetical protein
MPPFFAMAGLVPAIHVCADTSKQDVGARDKPGRDEPNRPLNQARLEWT